MVVVFRLWGGCEACCSCSVLTACGRGCVWRIVGEVKSTALDPVVVTGMVGNANDSVLTLDDRSMMSRLVVDGSELVL